MRDGNVSPASTRWTFMVGTLVTISIAIGMGPARAQTPSTPQAEATAAHNSQSAARNHGDRAT